MNKEVVIESIGSVSPLGSNPIDIIHSLQTPYCHFQRLPIGNQSYPVIPIHTNAQHELSDFLKLHPEYKKIDRTVQLALLASRICLANTSQEQAEWTINAGSSRGATEIWETNFKQFHEDETVPVKSSPLTTLGNISSHVAQHLKLTGFHIDHSITCSSGLQALANGMAWLKSGMSEKFMAIGTEAPLTPFTVSQMAVLGIYTKENDSFPCKPCAKNSHKTNTFMLGEAGVCLSLNLKHPVLNDIVMEGIGTASEQISNPTAISADGFAFVHSMQNALRNAQMESSAIDLIIPHSPGTYKGDMAEKNAIESVMGDRKIPVINHKFLTGHTLGASGLLSIELGYYILQHGIQINFPYPSMYPTIAYSNPRRIMVNAMGFGGNAVSILLKKV